MDAELIIITEIQNHFKNKLTDIQLIVVSTNIFRYLLYQFSEKLNSFPIEINDLRIMGYKVISSPEIDNVFIV